MQDRVCGQTEHVHERTPDHVGQQYEGRHGRHRRGLRVHEFEAEEADQGRGDDDERHTDPSQEVTKHAQERKVQGIPRQEVERSLRGLAEWRAHERDLNIRFFAHELQAFLEHPNEALHATENGHHDLVLPRRRLPLQVEKRPAHELHSSDDRGTKRKGAEVAAECIFHPGHHCAVALVDGPPPLGGREEPGGAGASDDADADGDDQLVAPQEDEEAHQGAGVQVVARRRALPTPRLDAPRIAESPRAGIRGRALVADGAPGEAAGPAAAAEAGRVVGAAAEGLTVRQGLAGHVAAGHLRQHGGGGVAPEHHPQAGDDRLHHGHRDDQRRLHDEDRGGVVDGDRELDLLVDAEHDEQPGRRQHPAGDGESLQGPAHPRVPVGMAVRAVVVQRGHAKLLTELPPRRGVGGVAPDVHSRSVGVPAEVLAKIGGGILRTCLPVLVRVLRIPPLADPAVASPDLHSTVVLTIESKQLQLHRDVGAGPPGVPVIAPGRCVGFARLDQCVATAVVAAHVPGHASTDEHRGHSEEEAPDGDLHEKPQDEHAEEAENQRGGGDDGENVQSR
mmetsp:Transcript_77714/g.251752  ORF Transcript_77714/g.251752 Transcript_77714/m.251752 type:complete len:563 (-) Transcript_77714:1151-2839(-)